MNYIEQFECDYSFIDRKHIPVMMQWLAYRTDKGMPYKTATAVRVCYNAYVGLCDDDPIKGQRLVERSISHGWYGLFAPDVETVVDAQKNLLDRLNLLDEAVYIIEDEGIQAPQCVLDRIEELQTELVSLKGIEL